MGGGKEVKEVKECRFVRDTSERLGISSGEAPRLSCGATKEGGGEIG